MDALNYWWNKYKTLNEACKTLLAQIKEGQDTTESLKVLRDLTKK